MTDVIGLPIDGMTLPHCAKGTGKSTAPLNVRSAPNTSAKIIGTLSTGTSFIVWAKDGEWCIIQRADGLTGWSNIAYMALSTLAP